MNDVTAVMSCLYCDSHVVTDELSQLRCHSCAYIAGVRLDWTGYRPGFLRKFIESHLLMFANNRNLKQNSDEVPSRPWMWPLAYRVCVTLDLTCHTLFPLPLYISTLYSDPVSELE